MTPPKSTLPMRSKGSSSLLILIILPGTAKHILPLSIALVTLLPIVPMQSRHHWVEDADASTAESLLLAGVEWRTRLNTYFENTLQSVRRERLQPVSPRSQSFPPAYCEMPPQSQGLVGQSADRSKWLVPLRPNQQPLVVPDPHRSRSIVQMDKPPWLRRTATKIPIPSRPVPQTQ